MIERAEVSGPGFINLTLRDDWIAAQATGQLGDPRLGVPPGRPRRRRVVVDYSAPNVAKEMHVGHLRTTIVGDAVVRVLEYLGDAVIRANHIGDWGTQFGMLLEHLLDVGEEPPNEQLAAGEINAFYQAANAKFDADPAFAERSRHRVVALQAGDPSTLRLWHDAGQRHQEVLQHHLRAARRDAHRRRPGPGELLQPDARRRLR